MLWMKMTIQSIFHASVAQLVAQRIRNAWVAGSSPAGSFKELLQEQQLLFYTLSLEKIFVFTLVLILHLIL